MALEVTPRVFIPDSADMQLHLCIKGKSQD